MKIEPKQEIKINKENSLEENKALANIIYPFLLNLQKKGQITCSPSKNAFPVLDYLRKMEHNKI